MGTLFEVLLRGEDAEHLAAVADAVLDEVERIERLLSRFDPRSEISRINRLAAKEDVQVDHEVTSLLKTCFDACEWTDGAFDITATSRVHAAVNPGAHAGSGVAFDFDRRRIRFALPEIQLDLGGIGKGYALDLAAELLREHSIEHALLHGGTSSVLARGCANEGEAWKIRLHNPATGKEIGIQRLASESLSVSAVDEQGDIIDPVTGQPLHSHLGVAVIAGSATDAEILSTALVCLGREREGELLRAGGDPWTSVVWW